MPEFYIKLKSLQLYFLKITLAFKRLERNKLLSDKVLFKVSPTVIYSHLPVFVLFTAVLEELVNSGRLRGTVVGGRQDKAVFVPDIYSKTQSAWVDSFFRQNGYLGNYFFFFFC